MTNCLLLSLCKLYHFYQVTGSVGYRRQEFPLGFSDEIKYLSAYVMQQDIMCPTSTCKEALEFSAKLRSKDGPQKQAEIIKAVSESLKLDDCASTRIGDDAIRGLSGGGTVALFDHEIDPKLQPSLIQNYLRRKSIIF